MIAAPQFPLVILVGRSMDPVVADHAKPSGKLSRKVVEAAFGWLSCVFQMSSFCSLKCSLGTWFRVLLRIVALSNKAASYGDNSTLDTDRCNKTKEVLNMIFTKKLAIISLVEHG